MDLVTGGAGFIGSHLVEELVRRGRHVRVLDDFSTGRRAYLAAVLTSVEILEDDILDPAALRRAMRGVERVFHQAALRSVPRSVEDPITTDRVNVEGTLQVLAAARRAGIRRVIYASSSSVYGASDGGPQREDDRPRPVSPYAVSKLAGEHYCRVFSRLYGLPTVSLRYFNVFGPRQDPTSTYAAVIPRFIHAALAGESLEIHGDGLQSRDFTHVRNVVVANCLAADAAGVDGEVLNVARGKGHSLMDIIAWLSRRLAPERLTVRWHHTPPRPGDVQHTLGAIDRAARLLGYQPAVSFRAGLEDTLRWVARVPQSTP
ncbi:MAG TPA: NAD-dependent epimerase/dehydratase family protein [Candidatus Binatia bacterium]|nr:NAD-dependent epimerase/dehydratase family protein [Candidatus Binatia bacterium]